MTFLATSFGPGSFVRFKILKSHQWAYAIYRGVQKVDGKAVSYMFSEFPLGPVTRWMSVCPEFIECAVTQSAADKSSIAQSPKGEL